MLLVKDKHSLYPVSMGRPFIIAIVGGSYCGKSSFARTLTQLLQAKLSAGEVVLIEEKDYVDTLPGSIEGREYNYTRLGSDLASRQEKIVIVEGFYLLSRTETRLLFSESVFIELDEEARFDKKLKSETPSGVSALDVYKEFHGLDKPLYDRFIAPSKVHATRVIKASDFVKELNKFAELVLSKI